MGNTQELKGLSKIASSNYNTTEASTQKYNSNNEVSRLNVNISIQFESFRLFRIYAKAIFFFTQK